jgi:hypothetical protein
MTIYAYIEESGIKHDQQVMIVSLVMLDSKYAHIKIQKKILNALYPNLAARAQSAKAAGLKPLHIHFTELEPDQRRTVAEVLAAEQIHVLTCVHYHDGCPKSAEEQRVRYSTMVKLVVAEAIRQYEDLELAIAFTSSFHPSYQIPLCEEIENIRTELHARHGFRKLKVDFFPASLAGVQLADVYAGARREHLLFSPPDLVKSGAFDFISHHYSIECQDP